MVRTSIWYSTISEAASAAPGQRQARGAPIAKTLLADLLEGQYFDPIRVVAFNTAEGWSLEVSEEIADELAQRLAMNDRDIPRSLEEFLERHGSGRPAQLPLPLRGAT